MTEPGIEQTEEAAPAVEFSDELSDEALDRGQPLACVNRPCHTCFVG